MDYSFRNSVKLARDDKLSMTFELAMRLRVLYSLGVVEALHMSHELVRARI